MAQLSFSTPKANKVRRTEDELDLSSIHCDDCDEQSTCSTIDLLGSDEENDQDENTNPNATFSPSIESNSTMDPDMDLSIAQEEEAGEVHHPGCDDMLTIGSLLVSNCCSKHCMLSICANDVLKTRSHLKPMSANEKR